MFKLLGRVSPFAIGGALAYFLDPDNGNRRRKMALQRLGGITRTAQRRGERAASYAASQAAGKAEAVDGVVELRGEVADPGTIDEIVRKAEGIPGVRKVENLMHTPGTEAPTR